MVLEATGKQAERAVRHKSLSSTPPPPLHQLLTSSSDFPNDGLWAVGWNKSFHSQTDFVHGHGISSSNRNPMATRHRCDKKHIERWTKWKECPRSGVQGKAFKDASGQHYQMFIGRVSKKAILRSVWVHRALRTDAGQQNAKKGSN